MDTKVNYYTKCGKLSMQGRPVPCTPLTVEEAYECPNSYAYKGYSTEPKQLSFDFMDGPQPPETVNDTYDPIANPEHYTRGSIEVYDFIEAWDLNFAEGNVVKYVVRAPYKGTRLKDLKKAREYIDKLIKKAEKEEH